MKTPLDRLHERREEGHESGFTLTELLVIFLVLAILASIVILSISMMTSSSAKASCESDVQTVDHAVLAYFEQMASWPARISDLEVRTTGSDGSPAGPWLHNTPTNGKHYEIILADGTTVYNAWLTVPSGGPPAAPSAPPKGTVIVENAVNAAFQAAPNGTIYATPTTPTGVSSGTTSPDVIANTISDACAYLS